MLNFLQASFLFFSLSLSFIEVEEISNEFLARFDKLSFVNLLLTSNEVFSFLIQEKIFITFNFLLNSSYTIYIEWKYDHSCFVETSYAAFDYMYQSIFPSIFVSSKRDPGNVHAKEEKEGMDRQSPLNDKIGNRIDRAAKWLITSRPTRSVELTPRSNSRLSYAFPSLHDRPGANDYRQT